MKHDELPRRFVGRPRTMVAIAALCGLFAVFVRWYFVTHARVLQPIDQPGPWGDAAEYYRYAWNLLHHHVFSIDFPSPVRPEADSFRDPGFPAFLAIWMWLTSNYDSWYAGVVMSQVILGGVTVACSVLVVRDILPSWLAAAAALAMAVWPHSVAMPAYVLSENLASPLYAIAALSLSEAVRRQSRPLTVVAGISFAGASLTNAVLGPLVVPMMLVLAWKRLMAPRLLLLLIAVTAAPLVAWNLRNSTVSAPVTSGLRAEMNLVQGSWPTYHLATQLWARKDPVGIQTQNAINNEIWVMHFNAWQGLKLMASRMARAPGTYLRWYVSKPALLWGWEIGLGSGDIYVYPTHESPFIVNPVMKAAYGVAYVFNGVLALLALAGAFRSLSARHPNAGALIFATTALWVTAVYGVLQSDPRYSIPFRSLEIALACVAIADIAAYLKARRNRTDKVSTRPTSNLRTAGKP